LQGDKTKNYDNTEIKKHLEAYDLAWAEWKELAANNTDCATIYQDSYFMGDKPGMGASVDTYREMVSRN